MSVKLNRDSAQTSGNGPAAVSQAMKAIAFALPQESRDFVAVLREPRRSGSARLPVITGKLGAEMVAVFHTGVGPISARQQLARFWQQHHGIEAVIGAGFAGALDPFLSAGALILWGESSQWLICARAALGENSRIGLLASAPEMLETPRAKAQWAKLTGAVAVDMETATLAAFFDEKGVPFLALRAISDTAGEILPVPFEVWFDLHAQQPRPARLLRFLLDHPGRIVPFIRFVRTVTRVRRVLAQALVKITAMPCPDAAIDPAQRRQ